MSWALRLPRQLRATRCQLSLYLESTMLAAPAGLLCGVANAPHLYLLTALYGSMKAMSAFFSPLPLYT